METFHPELGIPSFETTFSTFGLRNFDSEHELPNFSSQNLGNFDSKTWDNKLLVKISLVLAEEVSQKACDPKLLTVSQNFGLSAREILAKSFGCQAWSQCFPSRQACPVDQVLVFRPRILILFSKQINFFLFWLGILFAESNNSKGTMHQKNIKGENGAQRSVKPG